MGKTKICVVRKDSVPHTNASICPCMCSLGVYEEPAVCGPLQVEEKSQKHEIPLPLIFRRSSSVSEES